MKRKKILFLILSSVIAALLASCSGGAALRFDNLSGYTGRDDYLSAINNIRKNQSSWYGKNNQFLYNMDIGSLYHFAGKYDSSTVYLQRASDVYDGLFARSITNEAASLLINDNVRPYRSRPYELVLLHQFNALNYLAQDNTQDALVEARSVQLLFNEWERKDRHDQKYSNDAMFHYLSSIAYDASGSYDDAMISLYKAVETFKKGPVPLPEPVKNYACYMFSLNNRDQDAGLLKISADLPRDRVPGLQNDQTEIILIGYAGKGPSLAEDKWWGTYIRGGLLAVDHYDDHGSIESFTMPAPLLPDQEFEKAAEGRKNRIGTTFHVSFSLPKVRTYPSETSCFRVRLDGQSDPVQSIVINDLDRQLEKNLIDSRAATMSRTVIRTLLRTISAQTAKAKMETANPLANLLLNMGTDFLADKLEHADVRSCFLVPKTIQVARIPVQPGVYSLRASACNGAGQVIGTRSFENISVKQGQKKILFYPSFR